ncbi:MULTISPECIES: LytTR family DNA-binding domain-containing protein [unclassified Kaistella]|uniref:LytR/AlgR family response regulator transcription factor n=1 Tax=unclassified Kaistella TaxID=2762626 RepID=UPI0027369F4F|nr:MULTISPECIES: LytTR family DNA-binding domain-containing protein [unclassified Kaistella]MDP2452979.1 LytTR family DNA-binding domain-containing protein [Kaistella sp. SH11-4b]MDP2455888.1 LytTR family DNA-binding domain-containing protein [Kaistella sp. SH40-3]MDP2458792.1 LytTR family DNA-binding domain-containing protein [Kaistella sp. SH19-2b]
MIKTLIIEDEKPAARKLERLLSLFADLELVAVINSVEEGIDWFQNNPHPDLIFSDIVLGDGLSFDIFEKVPTKSFMIYTTAFDQYTLKAFKLNSIDYLLKPIMEEDLEKAISKFKSFLPSESSYNTLEIKSLIKEEKQKLSRILVKIGYNLKIVQTDEVSCFYSENKIVYLQTKERNYPTDFTLDELQEVLDDKNFFRVNRQFIINSNFIKNIHTSPYYKVEMEFQPEEEITVSRDRVKDFKDWLSN